MVWQFLKDVGRNALCGAALLTVANLAEAQINLPTPPPIQQSANVIPPVLGGPQTPASVAPAAPAAPGQEDLKARLDRLEKQNQELMQALQNLQARPPGGAPGGPVSASTVEGSALNKGDVQKIVGDYMKSRDDELKASDAAKKAQGFTVGESLGMTAKWNHGLWLESADKAFKIHFGGRTQLDVVGVQAPENVQFGKGGIGAFDDAVNPRRARFAMEGTVYEVIDFNFEWDFVNTTQALNAVDFDKNTTRNNTFNVPVPTDLWITLTHLPWIGNFRLGNSKPLIGFEHLTSSRFLNFMERSLQFDAYLEEGDNGFAPGMSIFNNYGENDRGTWGAGIWKTTRAIYGWNVGDGELSYIGRATYLPVWRDNGRTMLHVGMGAAWKDLDDDVARYRTRTLIRNGPAALHNIVAVAQVHGKNEAIFNPELVAQVGPFLIQSEYIGTYMSGVDRITRTPLGTENIKISPRSYFTQGAYVEALYFLTGESRDYNKKTGSFGRVIPFRNYFCVPGQDGGNLFSSGAWQVGARYSYLDLDNNGINGGTVHSGTVGLNWFLNPNFKIQWNYEYGHRMVAGGTSNGYYQGAGMRFAFDW
jgi:phosphate-selective porin OprO/OprP